jgi:hypothetical protein
MSIMQLVQIKRRAVEINNYICNSALGIENEQQIYKYAIKIDAGYNTK